jgi:HAD superfamily hydrolase (TIGR01450 family)
VKAYCIGTQGLGDEMKLCGLEPIGMGPDTLDGKTLIDLESYPLDPDVGCVVVGLDYDFTFVKAAKAVAYLENKNCLFLATNSDNRIPTSNGRAMPCCGSILAMIQTASQRRPDAICGKPEEAVYDVIQKYLKLNKRRTLFIGDRLNTDMLFAGRAGFHSLLVLSGVHNLDDVRCKENSLSDEDHRSIPNYYISSLGELANLI